MFMAADRQPKMRAMIMADDRGGPPARRSTSCCPLQQEDFEGLFEEMAGLPVTIRLLDPPLHEFLPQRRGRRAGGRARARSSESDDLDELERTLERVHALSETNPMLGTRGVRLGDPPPRDLRDAGAGDRARGAGGRERTRSPQVEIMIPLVAYEKELELMRELVERVVAEEGGGGARPADRHDDRAAAGVLRRRPDRRARRLLLVRHQRPHPDRARLLARRRRGPASSTRYLERKIVDRSPFETIDKPGVGWLVRLAAWVGREAQPGAQARHLRRARRRPRLDRASSSMAGLDYVSCSPYRVPIARVAAAQAALA